MVVPVVSLGISATAWHWADGSVKDRSSASDADLGIAWALSITLDGQATSAYTNALIPVADAASAEAAGAGGASGLLYQADAIQSRWPTYYGSAWDALGRVLLTTHDLGGCAPAAGTR
ncbi:MAG: hypothetical protein ACRDYY_00910 [Acidimicrobiales bacterium]